MWMRSVRDWDWSSLPTGEPTAPPCKDEPPAGEQGAGSSHEWAGGWPTHGRADCPHPESLAYP
eukprot:4602958-Prorocentrum_lima.AAC.1